MNYSDLTKEQLLKFANVIIITLDKDADIQVFNDFAEKITGYKKEEVIKKNWFDLFIPKRNGFVIPEVFQNVLKEMPEVSSYENPILCKDGSEKLINWKNTVLKDENGEISGILSIGTNITERKQAEEKLNFTKDRLIEAQQFSKFGWWEFDINENLITWSDELYKIFGITHDEDPLSFERVMQLIHPDYHDYHNEQ